MRILIALWASLALSLGGLKAEPAGDPLAHLRPGHPRLLLTKEELAAAVAAAKSDPLRAALHARIIETAENVLRARPLRHLPPGEGSLDEVRYAVHHILTCALAYRLTGDDRLLARARSDLRTVAAFPDWGPNHFLDVGEMSFAVSIGYDWLYPQLRPAERAVLKRALVEKSLAFAQAAYRPGGPIDKRCWWAVAMSNWNQACNSGLISAALAIADEEPALARTVIAGARVSLRHGMAAYNPDGEYPEGPGYWSYGTTYMVIALAELEGALGTDLGLAAAPGFDRTADYYLAVKGPFGLTFNYADCTDDLQNSPAAAWLAERYHLSTELRSTRALLAASVRGKALAQFDPAIQGEVMNRFFPLHAVWFPRESAANASAPELPLDLHFRGVADIALFRTAWHDSRALFLGFKAGDNKAGHAHLDLGAFALDADGVRWSLSLGPDRYLLPGYFGKKRWTYFRLNNHGKSTLTPGDELQNPKAVAPIVAFGSAPRRAFAVADLTAAYPGEAKRMLRGVALLDRSRVLVQDDVTRPRAGTVLHWAMITAARIDVSPNGRAALLSQAGRTLRVEILSPRAGRLHIGSTRPPTAAENQNLGTAKLALDVMPEAGASMARIAVLLTPVGDKWPTLAAPPISPLAGWR